MNATRRSCLQAALLTTLPVLGAPARAQSWPDKPLQLYVAFGAGNAGDLVARAVSRKLAEILRQPVVVENRPAPLVAASAVAKAKADGYTMLMSGSGMALTESLFTSLPYDILKDFQHVSTMAGFDFVLLTRPESPFKNLAAVLAFAKSNPGKLNMATARIGSTAHLAAEILKSQAGVDIALVPYKSTGEIITAVRGDQVQVAIELVPGIIGQIKQNLVTPLAVTSKARFPGLPNVPTVAESGVAGYEVSSWNGFSMPAGTPASIVQRLADAVATAVNSPDVRNELVALGASPMNSTPAQMTDRMRGDVTKWRLVVEKSNIPKQ